MSRLFNRQAVDTQVVVIPVAVMSLVDTLPTLALEAACLNQLSVAPVHQLDTQTLA